MALIAMAVHDTEENGRTKFTIETVESLVETVDFSQHRLIIVDNGSCEETKEFLSDYFKTTFCDVITNAENLGTAAAINMAWKRRHIDENLIKIDNDVVIHSSGWIEEMEEAIRRDPKIGQVGLKRKDLLEHPDRTDHMRSKLIMLPHKNGEPWVIAEQVNHVMGTCVMHSSALVDKIGGLWQMGGLYGFDDCLMSLRSTIAGFKNVFLPHIEIDHIDPGGTAYQDWKQKYSGERIAEFNRIQTGMLNGSITINYPL